MAKQERGILSDLARYGQIGTTFATSIFVGFGIGWLIDNKLFAGRTMPWFSFIFFGFGIAAGFKHLWDLSKKISDE